MISSRNGRVGRVPTSVASGLRTTPLGAHLPLSLVRFAGPVTYTEPSLCVGSSGRG